MTSRPLFLAAAAVAAWFSSLCGAQSAEVAPPPPAGRVWVVSQNAPGAADDAEATEARPLKTISAAAAKAEPGDTVRVHAGIYREWVQPARGGKKNAPITYEAVGGEQVAVRGSDVWKPAWRKVAPDLLEADLSPELFRHGNPFLTTISIAGSDKSVFARPAGGELLPETLGQVFVDGACYLQALSEAMLRQSPGSWLVNADGKQLRLHLAPGLPVEQRTVEIATRPRIFCPSRRGLSNITVRGFIFEHCANQGPFPQGGAVSPRSGKNWIIERNTIRWAKTLGLDCGSESWDKNGWNIPTDEADKKLIIGGGHLIRDNDVTDNGLCGIAGWNHQGTRIVGNRVERNNYLGFPHGKGWEEWAGIKLHAADALIEGNLVRNNEGHGIWIDNGCDNARITRNVILGNVMAGIFLELAAAPENRCLIDNNVIACTRSRGEFYAGDAIYAHDASDLLIVHNLFLNNAGFGVNLRVVTARKYAGKPVECSRQEIRNNLFVANNLGAISLPFPNELSKDNNSDYNIFTPGVEGDAALFRFNQYYCPFKLEDALARLTRECSQQKLAPALLPVAGQWEKNPQASLPVWQVCPGLDRHSLLSAKGTSGYVHALNGTLELQIAEEVLKLQCPPVAEIERDLPGNPYPQTTVLAGPFQNLRAGNQVVSLSPVVVQPRLRLTRAERDAIRVEQKLTQALQGVTAPPPADTAGLRWPAAENDANALAGGTWLTARQNRANPPLAGDMPSLAPATTKPLEANSTQGVSKSAAAVFLCRAPADGIYDYKIALRLTGRTGQTAGYALATLVLLDEELAAGRQLQSQDLNVADGFKGKELPLSAVWTGRQALRKGYCLAVKFQIVSPGPAPAGTGKLTVEEFTLTPAVPATPNAQ